MLVQTKVALVKIYFCFSMFSFALFQFSLISLSGCSFYVSIAHLQIVYF